MRIGEFSRQELRESQATIHELTSQILELQDRVNFKNDFGELHSVESACSGRHVPSQLVIVPSPRGTLSRDQSLRPDTWNLRGTSGNVFDNPPAPIDSVSTPEREMIHSWNLDATDGRTRCDQARRRLAARSEEQNRDTIPTPRFARRPSARNSLFPAEGKIHIILLVISKDCKSRSFMLTSFTTPSTFLVGR